MNKKEKRKQQSRTMFGEINAFTPEEEEALRVAADALHEGFPWLYADERIKRVAMSASFPRSVAGGRQDDPLLRRIYYTSQNYRNRETGLRCLKIVEMVTSAAGSAREELTVGKEDAEAIGMLPGGNNLLELCYTVGELQMLLNLGEPFQPKTDSEFFSRIAEGLNYLDTPEPTLGDFAVEALQNAFVGLMQREYGWGKKGLPTKGDVTEMAKAFLEKSGQKVRKSGWTGLLEKAGLGWLKPGKAGRPLKREVDKTRKLQQEINSIITKQVNALCGGDLEKLAKFRDKLKAASGGQKLVLQDETERLKDAYQRPKFSEEELR